MPSKHYYSLNKEKYREQTRAYNKAHYVKKGLPIGEKHHAWKGDKVGYLALHDWVKRKLGKPTKCEDCGADGLSGKKIQWANRSGLYKRDLEDWIRLCAKCHHKFDKKSDKIWAGHIKNSEKQCYCGRVVMCRDLCSLHYNKLNLQERGLLVSV